MDELITRIAAIVLLGIIIGWSTRATIYRKLHPDIPNTRKWKPNERALPMEFVQRGQGAAYYHWGVCLLLLPALLFWGLFATLFSVLSDNTVPTIVWTSGIVSLIASFFLILFIVNHFYRREQIQISARGVSYFYKDLRGTREWKDPLMSFRGLKYQSMENNMRRLPPRHYWSIEMIHNYDSSKSIDLFIPARYFFYYADPVRIKEKLDFYSKLLGLKIIE